MVSFRYALSPSIRMAGRPTATLRTSTMLRLLIADDSDAVRTTAAEILTEMGFSVTQSPSALDALAKSQAELADVVIVDAGLDGALELIQSLRVLPGGSRLQIYYSVTKVDLRCLMAAKKAGATDFLLKPFDRKVLGAAFSAILALAA
jgi:two-component system chemotaxis response regulator CheY